MARRNPAQWLMTDERMGDALWPALRRLPPGGGVVFRHHATPPGPRRALLRRVERIATARRLVLVVAGGGSGKGRGKGKGKGKGKGGVHGAGHARVGKLHTAAAHDTGEARRAVRRGAQLLFVSPLFATRSHPGMPTLGPAKAARIATGLGVPTIALGGMDARRWVRIRHWGFAGWAGIDAWLG